MGRIRKGDVAPLLVVLVSLLCIAYGVERLTYSQSVEARLDTIDALLRQSPNARFTENTDDIWSSIRAMMLAVDHNIRTVQAGDRPTDIPDKYKDLRPRLADRLNEKKKQYRDVWYRVVLVFSGTKTPDEIAVIKKENSERLKFYSDLGLKDNVQLRIFTREPIVKFDVLIVDTRSVSIGFDTFEGPTYGNVAIQNAMIWENQPALAAKLARWFDQSVWQAATPYDDWIKVSLNPAAELIPRRERLCSSSAQAPEYHWGTVGGPQRVSSNRPQCSAAPLAGHSISSRSNCRDQFVWRSPAPICSPNMDHGYAATTDFSMRLRPFFAEAGARLSWATLWRSASIRLTTFCERAVARSRGAGMPACFFLSMSATASS